MSYEKLDDETLRSIKNNEEWHDKIKNEHTQFENILEKVFDYGMSEITIKNPDGTIINVDESVRHTIFYMIADRKRELKCMLNDIDNIKEE